MVRWVIWLGLASLAWGQGQNFNTSSGGTVGANSGTAGCVAYYAAAGGSTTVGADANLCDATLGTWTANISAFQFTHTSPLVISTTATNGDITFTPNGTGGVVFPTGTVTNAGVKFFGDTAGAGLFKTGSSVYAFGNGAQELVRFAAAFVKVANTSAFAVSSSNTSSGSGDLCWDRSASGVWRADANTSCNDGLGKTQVQAYTTTANCAGVGTSASPSVVSCSAASAGSFSCATNAVNTCTVNTTAVTANSQIFLSQREDTTTGTRLGVTCNVTPSTVVADENITAVVAATSFSFALTQPTTNPNCYSYFIIN